MVVLPGIEPGSGASETLILSIVRQDLFLVECCLKGLKLLNLNSTSPTCTTVKHLKLRTAFTITSQTSQYCCQIFLLQLRAILRQKTFL